jgi:hypothetical protein
MSNVNIIVVVTITIIIITRHNIVLLYNIICGSRQKKERIEFPWEVEFGSRSEIRVYIQVKKMTI